MDEGKKQIITIVVALVIVAAIVGLAWYMYSMKSGSTTAPYSAQPNENAGAQPSDLGSQLYDQAQNPVQGKLPDTTPPVTNPLSGVYKNPFSN